jgi:hypothetical protein
LRTRKTQEAERIEFRCNSSRSKTQDKVNSFHFLIPGGKQFKHKPA